MTVSDPLLWLVLAFGAVVLVAVGAQAHAAWRGLGAVRRTLLTVLNAQEELRHDARLLAQSIAEIAGLLRQHYLPELRRRTALVRAAREKAGNEAGGARAPYLFIIRRGEEDIYRSFRERLQAPDLADVIWDRRNAERRGRSAPVATERRRGERRAAPSATWNAFGFVMSRQADAAADSTTGG